MNYRSITSDDAEFLTEIFSISEYELYFAENKTTKEEWKERIDECYGDKHSFIVSDGAKDVGWLMYEVQDTTCLIDIIVLLPAERHHGYGKKVLDDLLRNHPQITTVKLDVQQRNKAAIDFYEKLGFVITSEELQPVSDEDVLYYNMTLSL